MIKCIIFDLDNTLYDQVDYAKDLMNHLAFRLSKKYDAKTNKIYNTLLSYWMEKGPFYGYFFDDVLEKLSISDDEVRKLISISHSYKPNISTYPGVFTTLTKLKTKYYLAMITDGNENVQKNKINALGVKKFFKKIVYTGKHMKPDRKGYQMVLNHFNLEAEEAVYVGDNPVVDFITPNKMNMTTIRVLKGYFKDKKAGGRHQSQFKVNNFEEIFTVLNDL